MPDQTESSSEVLNIATIMFVDIVGCSTISNVLGIKKYGEFLEEFKQIAEKRIKAILLDNYRIENYERRKDIPEYLTYNVRGDEACVILFSDYNCSEDDKELARTRDANTAIEIAIQIKQDWMACKYNKDHLKDGKLPCDLGIGINSGPVHIKKDDNGKPLPEGYAINLAKRIEGESRRGKYSGIIVGQLTKSLYDNDVGESEAFFNEVEMANLKGILQAVPTYEIKYFTMPTDLGLISTRSQLLAKTINENKRDAKRLLPHTQKAWQANQSSAWQANVYGNQCLIAKKYEEAERAFVQLRKAHPKDAEPHCLLGNVYGEQGDYENEKWCYEQAIKLNPYVPEWHYYLGLCLSYILKEKKRNLSEEDLKKEIDKGDLKKEIDEILEYFDEAIYLHRGFSWAYYDKACVLNYYGRKGEAQAALDEAKEMDFECELSATSEPYLKGLQGGPPIK